MYETKTTKKNQQSTCNKKWEIHFNECQLYVHEQKERQRTTTTTTTATNIKMTQN